VQIFDDLNADQIEAIPETNIHRDVDTELVKADKEGEYMSPMPNHAWFPCHLCAGYVKTYTILPSGIYGLATGELVSHGIQNPRSIGLPLIIRGSLHRGRGGVIGAGQNISNNVHIDDCSCTPRLFIIFNLVLNLLQWQICT